MVSFFFPPKTIEKMKALRISEDTIYDVYNHGEHKKTTTGGNMAVQKYNGYEVGIFYVQDLTGCAITAVWKRDRR